jgi:hypothetical protein
MQHAATLALVGWYLMVPQPHMDANTNSESHDAMRFYPLSEWVQAGSFDTAAQCKADIDSEWLASVKKGAPNGWLLYGVCVASDDPRLKQ